MMDIIKRKKEIIKGVRETSGFAWVLPVPNNLLYIPIQCKQTAKLPNLTISYIAEKLLGTREADTLVAITLSACMASGTFISVFAWLMVGCISP